LCSAQSIIRWPKCKLTRFQRVSRSLSLGEPAFISPELAGRLSYRSTAAPNRGVTDAGRMQLRGLRTGRARCEGPLVAERVESDRPLLPADAGGHQVGEGLVSRRGREVLEFSDGDAAGREAGSVVPRPERAQVPSMDEIARGSRQSLPC